MSYINFTTRTRIPKLRAPAGHHTDKQIQYKLQNHVHKNETNILVSQLNICLCIITIIIV
jgi:hypothetical protein